jgi:DUF4097 and DUF4098 domain-containing protein YvlB
LIFPAFSAVLLPATARADNECRYRADRAAEASIDGIEQIVIQAGAGSLEVQGEPGLQRMQARGDACASDGDDLERLQIRVERKGDTLVISSVTPDTVLDPRSWFGGQARLDVSIKVPVGIALHVEDASGDARISNVRALKLSDGSGSLRIEDIKGSLEVDDGSGEVTIARVEGPLSIEDGSGEVDIKQITGDVTIVNDGSGEIRIESVSGSVKIENDGSGAIRVSRVKRDVRVDRDGSGEIVVQHIDGNLSVGKGGSGGIRHERIGGSISLPDNES